MASVDAIGAGATGAVTFDESLRNRTASHRHMLGESRRQRFNVPWNYQLMHGKLLADIISARLPCYNA